MNAPDPPNRQNLLAEAYSAGAAQRRRLAEVRAREHVGAAGWAQTSTLEAIIRAGQEGLAATNALRQVVRVTSEQLRHLPIDGVADAQAEHAQVLENVLEDGERQVMAAQSLNDLMSQALEDVARTPITQISVQRLKDIQAHIQQQVQALQTIMASAQAQTDTLRQVAALDQIMVEHQQRIDAVRQFSAEAEVQSLGGVGEQVVHRIAEIDEAHPHQLDALTRIAEAVVDKLLDTGAPPSDQAEALDKLAKAAQDKSDQLREQAQPG